MREIDALENKLSNYLIKLVRVEPATVVVADDPVPLTSAERLQHVRARADRAQRIAKRVAKRIENLPGLLFGDFRWQERFVEPLQRIPRRIAIAIDPETTENSWFVALPPTLFNEGRKADSNENRVQRHAATA